ncbi:MAG TPA: nitroreductase family protein [Clostridia bacterium]|jgi:nitroreductase|nr:nitroreductase family protein [Clostridia bacterium]
MDALTNIYSRISTRDFTDKPVSEKDISTIMQAGMAAPVGRGLYDTLHLTLITNKDLLDEISKAADWSGARPNAPLYDAPVLILVSSKLGETPNIEYSNVGCVMQTMALAATSLGLGNLYLWGCIYRLKSRPDIIKKFELPEGFVPISALGVGYSKEPLEKACKPRHTITTNAIR